MSLAGPQTCRHTQFLADSSIHPAAHTLFLLFLLVSLVLIFLILSLFLFFYYYCYCCYYCYSLLWAELLLQTQTTMSNSS